MQLANQTAAARKPLNSTGYRRHLLRVYTAVYANEVSVKRAVYTLGAIWIGAECAGSYPRQPSDSTRASQAHTKEQLFKHKTDK
jgi:hypothetical protein